MLMACSRDPSGAKLKMLQLYRCPVYRHATCQDLQEVKRRDRSHAAVVQCPGMCAALSKSWHECRRNTGMPQAPAVLSSCWQAGTDRCSAGCTGITELL